MPCLTLLLTTVHALGPLSHILSYAISFTYRNGTLLAGRISQTTLVTKRTTPYNAMSADPLTDPYHAFSTPTPSGEGMFHDRDLAMDQKGTYPCSLRFEHRLLPSFPAELKTCGTCMGLQSA